MADYSALKATIDNNVNTNGQQAITGAILNDVLNEMVDVLGEDVSQLDSSLNKLKNTGTDDFQINWISGEYYNADKNVRTSASYSRAVLDLNIPSRKLKSISLSLYSTGAQIYCFFEDSEHNTISAINLSTSTIYPLVVDVPENASYLLLSNRSVQGVGTATYSYFEDSFTWIDESFNKIKAKIGNGITWTPGNAYTAFGHLNPSPIPSMAYSSIFKVYAGDTIIVRSRGRNVSYVSEWTSEGTWVRSLLHQDTTSEVAEYSYTFEYDTYARISYSYAEDGSSYEIRRAEYTTPINSVFGKVNWRKGHYYNDQLQDSTNVNYESCLIDVSSMQGLSYFMKIAVPSTGYAYVSFADDDGNVLEQYKPQGYITGIVPANATKLYLSNRFQGSTPFQSVPIVIIANAYDMPSLPEIISMFAPVQESVLNGKKISFLGDSITEGIGASPSSKRYSSVLCALSGAVENNLGVAGTCLATNAYNRADSTRFAARATAENLSGSDLIIIFGGTNDFSYDTKAIGDLFSEQSITPNGRIGDKVLGAIADTDTFAGALHDLINVVRTNCPNVPILLVTPLNRGNFTAITPNSKQCNVNGDYLKDFTRAIKEIGAFYSIPVLDMSRSELDFSDATIASTYSADNLHPNNAGHEIIAKLILSYIEQNIILP